MKGIMIVLSILFILFIFTGCINRNIADFKGNWIMCDIDKNLTSISFMDGASKIIIDNQNSEGYFQGYYVPKNEQSPQINVSGSYVNNAFTNFSINYVDLGKVFTFDAEYSNNMITGILYDYDYSPPRSWNKRMMRVDSFDISEMDNKNWLLGSTAFESTFYEFVSDISEYSFSFEFDEVGLIVEGIILPSCIDTNNIFLVLQDSSFNLYHLIGKYNFDDSDYAEGKVYDTDGNELGDWNAYIYDL